MVQLLIEAESKTGLRPFAQMAKNLGLTVRYVAQKEKKSKNHTNPSPSGDPWWDDPRNVAEVDAGIRSGIEDGYIPIEDSPAVQRLYALCGERIGVSTEEYV